MVELDLLFLVSFCPVVTVLKYPVAVEDIMDTVMLLMLVCLSVSQPIFSVTFFSYVSVFQQLKYFVCVCVCATALKSVSDAKTVIPMVKQPVFLRSMSAPSDLEMIANQDLEFTHAPQRYYYYFLTA